MPSAPNIKLKPWQRQCSGLRIRLTEMLKSQPEYRTLQLNPSQVGQYLISARAKCNMGFHHLLRHVAGYPEDSALKPSGSDNAKRFCDLLEAVFANSWHFVCAAASSTEELRTNRAACAVRCEAQLRTLGSCEVEDRSIQMFFFMMNETKSVARTRTQKNNRKNVPRNCSGLESNPLWTHCPWAGHIATHRNLACACDC